MRRDAGRRGLIRQTAMVAVVVLQLSGLSNFAHAADAPYGFKWSQEAEALPKPSASNADTNIKELTYRDSRLPAQSTDTETVIVEVCDGFGLQQVRSISHSFTLSAAVYEFLDIYEQSALQYGDADQADFDHGTAAWSAQHIDMRMVPDENDKDDYRILMVTDGPQFATCEAEHARIIGRR
jgi:hypothetical protein